MTTHAWILLAAVTTRVAELRAADPAAMSPVPVDLVTAPGSGLDRHGEPRVDVLAQNRDLDALTP